ncbi:hypothetical protein FQR65_LT06141 [Abscondita terminalis]|nr:hypothetical protein FQR65_LT06141 [Abscondita terminalis]
MAFKFNQEVQSVIINTGNILSLNDITKKPGQNTTEELLEALNITLKDFQNSNHIDQLKEKQITIRRLYEDLASKIAENDINDLKIGLKIFVESDKEPQVSQALDEVFKLLSVTSVHNVIISYNNKLQGEDQVVARLKYVWQILEKYTTDKKILQIGLADVEEAVFRAIYEWATIKPAIIQINLATCCVVPPTLQTFCKDNEVQLLTHSDPNDVSLGYKLKTLIKKSSVLQQVRYKMNMVFQKNRENSFQNWKFDTNSTCNSKKMAEAGFYFIGTSEEQDAVQCFVCNKALDGWDENDDPWEEHISHSESCAFAKMRQPEENLTCEQFRSFTSQVINQNTQEYISQIQNNHKKVFSARLLKIRKSLNALKRK